MLFFLLSIFKGFWKWVSVLAVAISCWKQAYVLLELDMCVQKMMLEIMLVWIYGLS